MNYLHVKLLYSLIFTVGVTVSLYIDHMYFAIAIIVFAVLAYPTKNDFKFDDEEKYKRNFADIDAVLKDHEKAITGLAEIITRNRS